MSETKFHYMAAAVADALEDDRHNLGFRQRAYERVLDLLERAGVKLTEPELTVAQVYPFPPATPQSSPLQSERDA